MAVNDCVFCERLGTGEHDNTWYPDVVWFEPLNPVTEGHMLFIHRTHTRSADANPMIAGRVFEAAAAWAAKMRPDFNLITSSGPDATQTVLHFHVHYVPRHRDDGLMLPWTAQQH